MSFIEPRFVWISIQSISMYLFICLSLFTESHYMQSHYTYVLVDFFRLFSGWSEADFVLKFRFIFIFLFKCFRVADDVHLFYLNSNSLKYTFPPCAYSLDEVKILLCPLILYKCSYYFWFVYCFSSMLRTTYKRFWFHLKFLLFFHNFFFFNSVFSQN